MQGHPIVDLMCDPEGTSRSGCLDGKEMSSIADAWPYGFGGGLACSGPTLAGSVAEVAEGGAGSAAPWLSGRRWARGHLSRPCEPAATGWPRADMADGLAG